ncbi:MAG TPA: aminotransferase class IV [Vicinamibacterales bacterium]|nr:aminotransferase class IV [Vicinamibacterales bacterium]
MKATVNVNGRISDAGQAVVPVFDHGFLYGEGVYETLRTYNGRPFLFDRHLERLRASAAMLRLLFPLTDRELDARVAETLAAGGLGTAGGGPDAYIRILLTRGVGDLTYDPAACATPSLVIIVKAFAAPVPALFEEGVPAVLVSILRNHPGSLNPLMKSNNLLNNALAMQEALRRGGFEGIMRNYRGELAECTQSNLFIVKDGAVLTPPLESGLLAGVTRAFVLEMAGGLGIDAREAVLTDADLFGADEAFLTSTTREVLPIVRVDDQSIGTGRPGPVAKRLLAAFRQKAQALTATPLGEDAAPVR